MNIYIYIYTQTKLIRKKGTIFKAQNIVKLVLHIRTYYIELSVTYIDCKITAAFYNTKKAVKYSTPSQELKFVFVMLSTVRIHVHMHINTKWHVLYMMKKY